MISPRTEFKKIWYMMLSTFWVRFLFAYGLVLEVLNTSIAAGSYFFLTKIFQGTTTVMATYGTDVVSFIIVGTALNLMMMQSLTGIYSSLVQSYFDRSLERLSISPTSIYTLLFSRNVSGYLTYAVHSALWVIIGVFVFGVNLGSGNLAFVLLVLLLGIVATVGLGMLLSLVFFYSTTGKGGPNPVLVFTTTFANAFSGATFPVEIVRSLAPWLYPISAFLPQTHAISAARMILKGSGLLDPSVVMDVLYLILFAFVSIPIGSYLIKRGLDRVRKEGYAPSQYGGFILFG